MGHFDGVIDDFWVFDEWQVKDVPGSAPVMARLAVPGGFKRELKWVSADSQRIKIYVKPVSDKWERVPVKVEVDLGDGWRALSGREKT